MFLKNVYKNKYLFVFSILSLVVLLISAAGVFIHFRNINTPIIIHFDAYKGIDFLGTQNNVFGILLSGLATILINICLAEYLYRRERFVSYIFIFASFVLTLLILISVGVIISAN